MKKVISLLLALLMMVSLLPISAFAEAKDTCVWVNGEQFTSEKRTISCGSGTAIYDPDTATLTLSNATITQVHAFDETDYTSYAGIYANDDLKINLVGSNSIRINGNTEMPNGIFTEGDLIITGTGDLAIYSDEKSCGIWASSLTISGSGSVNIDTYNYGVYTDYLTVKDSVDVTVHGDEYGVFTRNGSVTLLGSGDVSILSDENGVVLWGNCTVQLKGSGKLTIHSGNGYQAVCNEENPESLVMLENPDNYTVMGAPDTDYVSYVPSTAYDVWVNGVQFTSARLAIDCGGTAIYDPDTATLTLDGAQITQTHEFTDGMGHKTSSAIYAKGYLKVNRVGESRIEPISDAAASGSGIYVEGELVITGTGDLAIYSDGESCGIWASSLTISGSGSVNIDTGDFGVYTDYLTAEDSVDVIVHGDEYGVFTRNGSVTLLGSGDVSISGNENGVVLWDDCTVQLKGSGNLKITAGSGKKAVCNEDNPESLVTLQNPDNYVVTGTSDSDCVYYEYSPFRNLWVDGKQFSAEKLTIECGSGTATYDPVTATVTLNGATITQTHADSGFSGAIYAGRDITLNVVGDSSISLGEYANGDGIYTAGNLAVMGNKALNITIKNENGYSDAVWVNGGKLTVDMEGDLTVDSTGTALSSTGDILISGSGSKTIRAGANGIYSSGADITLSGSGNVTIDAGYGIYAQTGNAVISGSGDIVIDAKTSGFNVIGDLTIGGSGKLTVDAGSYGLLCCNMIFTGERTADITAGEDGIVPAGEIELGGSGDITITAEEYGINVYYNGDVNISGSGKLTVTAGYKGIVSYNGAILSGSGEVEIYGKENAVYFDNVQGAVRLNGTGSPITLRADQGKKAVYNITTHQSPIAGTAFDDYKCVTGAPDTASVVYRLEHSYGETTYTWDNDQCTAARTCTVCEKTETETATGIYAEDTPATCTEPAKGHYRTIFLNVLFEDQNTEANSVTHGSPLGHDWSAWIRISEEQHQRMCKRDETHVETAKHDFAGKTCKDCGYIRSDGTNPVAPVTPVTPVNPVKPVFPFDDVKSSDWSYDDIYYVWEKGLMQGTSETTFAPKTDTSRAMIVTILYRLEGEPAFMNDNIFTDVERGSWYEKAVIWANGKGIVNGYGDGRFGPNDPITREQMAAILYRYAQSKGEGFTGSWMFLLDFEDAADVSSWADEAMHWCVMKGLINGVGNDLLDPQGYATREQVAAILHRFCENIVK